MAIDFELSPQQGQVREFLHQFARSVVRPLSLQWDRDHKMGEDFLLRLASMQGMMQGGEIPAEYGGQGDGVGELKDRKGKSQSNRFAMIGAEEMAWGDVS